MAHGIALKSTAGLIDIASESARSGRLIVKHNLSGHGGSLSVPSFSSVNGFFHARLTNNSALPPMEWSEGIKTLSWSTAGFIEHSTVPTFTVFFFRNR